ncbi:MAG TPA: phage holin family protein [Anaerolineae bacterium]|nr:phage holin family protein [Anaerolineae bacterium]HMR63490.1 phage holin family protein [Anaerolineae bacterium]
MNLLIRWVVTSLALFAAAWLVPGIQVDGNAWVIYIGTAVILGLVNALIRPLLTLLTCPLILLTLGLFTLVINALMLWLTSYLAVNFFGVGFYVDDFWAAFLGSVIVSVVSIVLSAVLKDEKK